MGVDTKWVLLVDDEADILASVRELLELSFSSEKLRIVEAHNGIDATVKVKNQKFDCIITDMKMPKKEGDAFIVSARQSAFNQDTPIIMLTGFPNKRTLKEHRFVYLIEKPFTHDSLTELVGTQLKVGNKGDRLAADMVNNLVNASKTFLTTVLKTEEFELQSPKAKRLGEKLGSGYVSQVNLYDNGVHNSFSLLVDEEALRLLSEKMENLKGTDLDRIALALGQSILKHSLRSMGGRSSVIHNILTFQGAEASEIMEGKKGILIPVSCQGVNLKILACGEKKHRSAAA